MVLLTTWGGNEYAWSSPTIIGLAVLGAVISAAFVVVERRAAEPMLPLTLFRNRNFTVSSAIGFFVGFSMFGAISVPPAVPADRPGRLARPTPACCSSR